MRPLSPESNPPEVTRGIPGRSRPNEDGSFLIIQTAFTGDVILATGLIEKIHQQFPKAKIDFLLRKGNEGLLLGHPTIREVLIWDKKRAKFRNLIHIIRSVRSRKYDVVVNAHRFASSGLITALSGARHTTGFDKNPLSFLFDRKVKHVIKGGVHEIDRNQQLIDDFAGAAPALPKLYPDVNDIASVAHYKSDGAYSCIAPTSVWFTKQFPREKWVDMLDLPELSTIRIFLLGAADDFETGEFIRLATKHPNVINLAGSLSYLESAALMKDAKMNYVNDSAPMHLASALNAPVTAVYCSTVPAFGFGPLSDVKFIIQTNENLECRPCGLHGYKECPLGHFKCAYGIEVAEVATIAHL